MRVSLKQASALPGLLQLEKPVFYGGKDRNKGVPNLYFFLRQLESRGLQALHLVFPLGAVGLLLPVHPLKLGDLLSEPHQLVALPPFRGGLQGFHRPGRALLQHLLQPLVLAREVLAKLFPARVHLPRLVQLRGQRVVVLEQSLNLKLLGLQFAQKYPVVVLLCPDLGTVPFPLLLPPGLLLRVPLAQSIFQALTLQRETLSTPSQRLHLPLQRR
mmetsp:Transcript_6571/g.19378  ORF Transcript_6571/g.19378 Transcript_6571/m.19378 type:complete len:215 (-) Transcript_6571:168-812(-)